MKRLKVVAFFVVVVGLLAVAGPASAHIATSSILPIKGIGSGITFIELVSPAGDNTTASPGSGIHLVFFNASCTRATSRPRNLTDNDIDVFSVTTTFSGVTGDGLVAIGQTNDGTTLNKTESPFEAWAHTFDLSTGVLRSYRHIRANDPERGTSPSTFATGAWPELRTGAFGTVVGTGTDVKNTLDFICPSSAVYGAWNSGQIPTGPTAAGTISANAFDAAEKALFDFTVPCKCFTQKALTDLAADFASEGNAFYVEFFGSGGAFKVFRTISVRGSSFVIHNQLNGVNETTLGGTLTTDTR